MLPSQSRTKLKQQSNGRIQECEGEFRVKAPYIPHVFNTIREILVRLRFGNLVY